jgi:hypothetical protein
MPAPLDCPEIKSWQTMLGDRVPPEERESYERHLESCPTCQERLDRLLLGAVRRFGNTAATPTDPTLTEVLERLYEAGSCPAALPETPDLYFLSPANRPDLLGTLGGYEVQEAIGQGGMGVVLKGFDPALHRLVAIKVMAAALAGSAMARRRFTREAQAAAAVCHDHIVAVYGVHETAGLPYLVMQYIPGESLQARLDRIGPLEPVEIVRIGLQTASGLAAAHAQGLIHRDIKPANLLLEHGLPRVKITDFGLARMADDVQLTRDGVVAGTPEYMAPEQARGEPVDHRADLFSLGSVLYACCTGHAPFRGETALAVLRRVNDEEPKSIRELNPEVPAWLEQLIARLLAKDPDERFQSAAEVAALLEGYLGHLRQPATVPPPELSSPPTRPAWQETERRARSVNPWARLLRVGALLLLVCLAGLFLLPAGQAPVSGPPPAGGLRDQFALDCRGRPLPADMTLFGPMDECSIKEEPEGLRLTLPRNRKDFATAGLSFPMGVGGDFEITLAFEVLEADEPGPASYGMGVMLSVNESGRVGCMLRAVRGQVISWDHWATVGGKRVLLCGGTPSGGKVGRIRLARTGTTLHYLWSPDMSGEDFRESHQCECSFLAEAVSLVRVELNADVGRRPGTLDVRLLELKVRSATPEAGPISGAEDERPARSKGWLVAVGILALVLLLSVPLVWLSTRRRSRTHHGPAAPISVQCSACGQKLKARAQAAGKTVKCPHCSQAVLVPAESRS